MRFLERELHAQERPQAVTTIRIKQLLQLVLPCKVAMNGSLHACPPVTRIERLTCILGA